MDMKKISRRQFMSTASAVTLGAVAANKVSAFENLSSSTSANKLAIAGGTPVRQNKTWPKWPYVDDKVVESVTKTTKSGIWCRIDSANGTVPTFEKEYASLMGAKYCVATGSGTQSLHTCVAALGIGPGD